jgi:hypothetical protein
MSLINTQPPPSSSKDDVIQSITLSSVNIELKEQVNSNPLNQPNSISKVSSLGVEIIIDQEDDKSPSHSRKYIRYHY